MVVVSGMEWSQRVAFGAADDPGPEARREGEGGKVGKWLHAHVVPGTGTRALRQIDVPHWATRAL